MRYEEAKHIVRTCWRCGYRDRVDVYESAVVKSWGVAKCWACDATHFLVDEPRDFLEKLYGNDSQFAPGRYGLDTTRVKHPLRARDVL